MISVLEVVRAEVRRLIEEDDDDDDERIAQIVEAALAPELLRHFARQWILHKIVGDLRRREARNEEQRARRQFRAERQRRAAEAGFDDVDEWLLSNIRNTSETLSFAVNFTTRLLGTSFKTGDGHTVSWLTATQADHESRIEWMETRVRGYEADIELHRFALDLLTTYDVDRLEALPESGMEMVAIADNAFVGTR